MLDNSAIRVCPSCDSTLLEGQTVTLKAKKGQQPPQICADCADQIDAALKAETKNPFYFGASMTGLVGGLLGAAIWYAVVAYAHIQFGLVAVVVGWLVGQAVVRGSGGKRGLWLQATSIAITLVALGLAEYEIVRHSALQQGYTAPLVPTPNLMVDVDISSLGADPLTLLFWLIAIFQAFSIPAVRKLQRA